MINIGGKQDMIVLAVQLAWYHHQNFKNGELHVKQQTKLSKNKASIFILKNNFIFLLNKFISWLEIFFLTQKQIKIKRKIIFQSESSIVSFIDFVC